MRYCVYFIEYFGVEGCKEDGKLAFRVSARILVLRTRVREREE